MALSTDSIDPKKSAPAKAADKSEASTKLPEPVAAPGATDPAVQQILAEQQTAVSNGDAAGIREANAKLNEHGYK